MEGRVVSTADDDKRQREMWPEHVLINRLAPLALILLGMALLLIGWLDDRDALAAIGFASFLAGVVLPRAKGPFKVGPGGVTAEIEPAGPLVKVTARGLPPGAEAEAQVEAVLPSGAAVTITEPLRANETVEFFGSRLLDVSRDLPDWWVTFRAPELSDAGWEALREAPDMAWLARSGASAGVGRVDPDNMPEPSSWHYRVIVKARDEGQAVAKVRGALEPHDAAYGWEAERVNLPSTTPGP
jgi:hypothetical protein